MPRVTLLPFRAPSAESVSTELKIITPPTDLEDLHRHWDPMIDLELAAECTLVPSFLRETGLTEDDMLHFTLTVDCSPTRGRWTARQELTWEDGRASGRVQLEVPGQEIGDTLTARASVVGDAITGDPHPLRSRHRAARIWTGTPVRIPLQQADRFPTTAVSFRTRHWPTIPWRIRCLDELEPGTHISAGMRLYLNTDLEEGRSLAEGSAASGLPSAVEADVLEELFGQLSRLERSEVVTAADDPDSPMGMAAVAKHNAENRLGISLLDALEWAREEPSRLKDIVREKTRFLRGDPS